MLDVSKTRRRPPKLSIGERIAASVYGAKTQWPSGIALYHRCTPADGIFIVLRGHVILRSPMKGGRGFVSAVAMPGETFGTEGLMNTGVYVTDATTADGAETLHLSSEQFRAFIREQPSDALALIAQTMAERSSLLERLHEMAALNVEERLTLSVMRLGEDPAFVTEDGHIRLDSSHQRLLCEMVGATRESTTLALSRLISYGAARRTGSVFLIDPGMLSERAHATLFDVGASFPMAREITA